MKRVADNHKQGIAETNLIEAQEFPVIRKMIDANLLLQFNHQTITVKLFGGNCQEVHAQTLPFTEFQEMKRSN